MLFPSLRKTPIYSFENQTNHPFNQKQRSVATSVWRTEEAIYSKTFVSLKTMTFPVPSSQLHQWLISATSGTCNLRLHLETKDISKANLLPQNWEHMPKNAQRKIATRGHFSTIFTSHLLFSHNKK